MDKLSREELKRYSRHLVLQEFGMAGQLKLKEARVLVVGAGGLGCPALLYLAAAGVGHIGIVDGDALDLSNLQRQVLFSEEEIGSNKADAAVKKLQKLNSHISCRSYATRLSSANALTIIQEYDVVIDCTDNFPTRYLLNDACVLLNKTLVYGSILKFEGQVSVFNYKRINGTYSANYRDLFPTPPDSGNVPNCEEAGVLGVLPGMIGSMQANETIKLITGTGQPLADKLLILDALSMEQTVITIPDRHGRDAIKKLIDYEDFCGINQQKNKYLKHDKQDAMKEITVLELQKLIQSGADFQLIDVREPNEFDICNLDGELIPMSQVPRSVDKIAKDKQVILHCRSGKRSSDMILWLEKNHGFDNLYNLKGGILAWAREIDPDMPQY